MSPLGPQPKRRFYYRREVKTGFWLRDFGQANEQQRHFNDSPISELHGEADSIPTSLKTAFYPPTIMECCLCLSALGIHVYF